MFTKPITSPIAPLTQNYFKQIRRLEGELDFSWSCFAAAVIRPRIPNYTGIYGKVEYMQPDAAFNNVDAVIHNDIRDKENYPYIGYYMVPARAEIFDSVKTRMKELGCEEITAIEKYVEQQLQMKLFVVFTHEESNAAFIFSPTDNLAVYHLCCAFTYTLLPKVFKDKPLSADELEIVKALSHKTPDMFVQFCSKALMPLKEDLMKAELTMCFRGFREAKVNAAKQEVEAIRAYSEQILNQYRAKIDELNNAIVLYEGLKVVNSDGNNEQEQEAIDYLVSCPRLHNIRYRDGELDFDIDTYLTNIDVMKFRTAVNRNDIYDSYRLSEDNPFYNRENRKLLLNALFNNTNPELSVRMRGHVVLYIKRNFMDAPRGESFDETNPALANCLTNPHFRYHGCPGQNRSQIVECLKQADIVSAIECSIASTGSVNIGETDITFRPFVQEILTTNKKIIHRNDGVDMTTAEALLWLTKKNKETAA